MSMRLGSDVCNASFEFQQNGLEFVFTNTSDVSDPSVTATWTFGDGASSSQFETTSHMYALGLYEICITVTSSGCIDTYCETLDLRDSCLALKADYLTSTIGGNPLNYQFTDKSGGPVGSHLWGFGDGQISTSTNPTHIYTTIGEYTVCLLILDELGNCTDSDCRTLYVGTTGTDPVEVQMKRITVIPNPVSIANPEVNISGFDLKDIGRMSEIVVHDINGVRVSHEKHILESNTAVTLPNIPGVYYLQVVTEQNRYGAMIAIQ